MNIIDFPNIKGKYSPGLKRLNGTEDIQQIVYHGTGGGRDAESILRWMLDGERAQEYKRNVALFHYLIDTNGDIYQLINDDHYVYHSGSGEHDMVTIGIEMVNHSPDNNAPYTQEQYDALMELTGWLIGCYPTINSIVGHGFNKLRYSHAYKNCPGGGFDWTVPQKFLFDNGFMFSYLDENIYNIRFSS